MGNLTLFGRSTLMCSTSKSDLKSTTQSVESLPFLESERVRRPEFVRALVPGTIAGTHTWPGFQPYPKSSSLTKDQLHLVSSTTRTSKGLYRTETQG